MADEIKKGLEGVYVAESKISKVDGDEGKIWYCGYDIDDLAREASYEEVLYLLWNQELPNKQELERTRAKLRDNRELPKQVGDYIDQASDQTQPMDLLRTTVSMLSSYDDDPNNQAEFKDKAHSILAKIPNIIARQYRVREGLDPVKPSRELGHSANFLYMLKGEDPSQERVDAMDSTLTLYAEHGMNASTFSAVVTASTLANLYSSLTSAIGTLQGPLHGGATETVIDMLEEVGSPDRAEEYIDEMLGKGEPIPGFGHRVYNVMDPRCSHFQHHIKNISDGEEQVKYETAEALRKEMQKRLGDKGIYPNTDLYSGILYGIFGIPKDYYTVLFASSRIAGWAAHVFEQLEDNRIMRPRVKYTGEIGLEYTAVEDR